MDLQYTIETAVPGDHHRIDEVIAKSYGNGSENHDGDEVAMVNRLRGFSKYRDDFEVVVKTTGGDILGHAMMIEVMVGDNAKPFSIASIVELSVVPEYQGHGIGQQILMEIEARARLAGYRAMSAVDFSEFFTQNGYIFADNFNIHSTLPINLNANLIKLLYDGALYNKGGKVYYPLEFFKERQLEV
ncbi:GNAT family N-acetyltransferase [Lentilactobacillus kosonis]|uniref:Acetyltransferase, GNAT family n=1 Tax=Lentilactobacillus kosonis TaxID=2810561 RepID=A0A401FIJ0_9LACO|nr:GNAT family N-acetyltransferase [Lentilactobacillus kosonis]GAY72116.1 acetyltransferase, GNAT family [Lentilactobacillus kosonis]